MTAKKTVKRKPKTVNNRVVKGVKQVAKPVAKPVAKQITPEAKKKSAARARELRLKTIFNITSDEYKRVLDYQDGRCAITKLLSKNILHIDHDHKTGLVRGLLTPWANKGIALFRDDPILLRAAADYLEHPPVEIALGEKVYGVIGRVSRKAKNRRYGPDGTKEPKPRTTGITAIPEIKQVSSTNKPVNKTVNKPVNKKPKRKKL